MRSCATRSTNLNGPVQTGLEPKSLPSASAALGETSMPARSVSSETKGADGVLSTTRAESGSTTSTRSIEATSPRRVLPCMVRWRSRLYFSAAASTGVPSWNFTPGRSRISSVFESVHSWPAASCGTISSFSLMSNSLSHRPAKTMRPV